MKVSVSYVGNVEDVIKEINKVFILKDNNKETLIGEMSFILGCEDFDGTSQTAFIDYNGNMDFIPKDKDYVAVMSFEKLITTIKVTIISNVF